MSYIGNRQIFRPNRRRIKKVAALNRKDGTDMRIIATVTRLLLPGTFTAVSQPWDHLIQSGTISMNSRLRLTTITDIFQFELRQLPTC